MENNAAYRSESDKNPHNNNKKNTDPLVSDEQRKKLMQILRDENSWRTLSMLNGCVSCGICTDSCLYYKSLGDPGLIPANKLNVLANILKKNRFVHFGSKQLTSQEVDELYRTVYENCTLCGKCGVDCPMGINTGPIFHTIRSYFAKIGCMPGGLEKPVATALEKWNYLGLEVDDFIETLEWIAEEIGDELEIEEFEIPIDKKDVDFMFNPHPLEVRDYPMRISAAIKILHAAKENYTLSSKHYDGVNYAYYSGHIDNMLKIVNHLLEARRELRAKDLVLAPCGHAYRTLRWEAEKNLGKKFPFHVYTFSELIDRYLREGRITVKKDTLAGPITYHDPCNIGRYGGVIEEPRNIVRRLTSQFVEMEPHGVRNFCCGGGGGLSATGDYGNLRVGIGKAKADQIRATGARVVVSNCYNCHTQLLEINEKYSLGVRVINLVEFVADALIME